jgi:hypothetical protein
MQVKPRLLALAAVLAASAALASVLLGGGDGDARPSPLVPRLEETTEIEDPFAWDPDRREEFTQRAALGLSHVLYAKSPGGVIATAQRVTRYRDAIEAVAGDAGVDADTIEGIVFLESAGRPDAQAGDDPAGAVGLTQILAETGQNLLDLRIDTTASRRLTRRIRRAERRGQDARAERLRAARRRVDERYDPVKALQATARYLAFARGELDDRDDMAVVSYHMGVGNLLRVLEAFGADDGTTYAEVFFDSSPLRHPEAWDILAGLGDDSSTYLWRVEAAKDIMRRFRDDPEALADRARRMLAKNSAEDVLRPEEETEQFAEPEAIETAVEEGELVPLVAPELRAVGIRVDPDMGELARRLEQPRSLYRALRPEALALLVYLARGTEAIARQAPLTLTSTVRDGGYQRLLTRRNIEATRGYSLHTTGYAFDILRRYRSRRHARAFQFMLDRLQALNLIAWVREPAAIHMTVGPDAEALLPLLRPAGA